MEIEWSLLASRQLNDVLDFVATEYGSITARKVFDKFDANVNSLLRNPNRGILDSDLSDSQFTVRHLQLFPNVLYYVVKGDSIIISAVMHYKQSPQTVYKTVRQSLERYR